MATRLGGALVVLAATLVYVAGGSSAPAAAAEIGYVSLGSPARLLDTRPGTDTDDGQFAGGGLRPAQSTLELPVAGRSGVPVDAASVAVNVTVVEPSASGYVTVYPCGQPRPTASNLNFAVYAGPGAGAGPILANLVIAKVGAGGRICLFSTAPTHLLVDVSGYFPGTDALTPLAAPARLLDTRSDGATVDGRATGDGRQPANSAHTLQVTGRAGIPTGATTVVLNVTVDQPQASGFATAYPCDSSLPTASNLNFMPSQTVPNAVVTRVSATGTVCLFTSASTHLIVDVSGYFVDASVVVPLGSPARLLDTRSGTSTIDGAHVGVGRRPIEGTYQLPVAGRAGVPADASAVILNVTVDDTSWEGFVTVYPAGTTRPNTSNLNYPPSRTVPNAVVARVGSGGNVCIFNLRPTHLVIDIAGYIVGPPPAAAGSPCPRDPGVLGPPPPGPPPVPIPTGVPPSTTIVLDPRFDTCEEANAAGYGPYLWARDPEYFWYPDPELDLVVCD